MSKEAVGVLSKYQTQIDPDGIEVGVSRQALDETLDYIAELDGLLLLMFGRFSCFSEVI